MAGAKSGHAFSRGNARSGQADQAVEINEKDVVKNVGKGRGMTRRAGLLAIFGSSACLSFGIAVGTSLGWANGVQARSAGPAAPIAFADLPAEAQQTERLVFAGGPFPYSRDGVVFMNREGHLDRKPQGYYHEYTVPTPGARDRGARRIICGGPRPTEPDGCFYTEDHYGSFHRILY
jgi:ribonuclease T1